MSSRDSLTLLTKSTVEIRQDMVQYLEDLLSGRAYVMELEWVWNAYVFNFSFDDIMKVGFKYFSRRAEQTDEEEILGSRYLFT